jgi:putative ABC transport system permease protein
LFIITIAWVNYINLATARSVERAREVGIRKVVGCERRQLIFQFLAESALVNLISMGIGIITCLLLQSEFNKLLNYQSIIILSFNKRIKWILHTHWTNINCCCWYFCFGPLSCICTFLIQTDRSLKGKFGSSQKGIFFRKALVLGQFTVTIGLIIGIAGGNEADQVYE